MAKHEERDPGSPSKSSKQKGSSRGEKASRRDFLRNAAAGIVTITLAGSDLGCTVETESGQAAEVEIFRSRWPSGVKRHWIGPEYWSNPLQDWRIADGRLELIAAGADRNVHVLTHELGLDDGTLEMDVRIGFIDALSGQGSAGFYVGVRGPLDEYRNNVIHGDGLKVGLATDGRLFIGEDETTSLDERARGVPTVLRLKAEPAGDGYALTLTAHDEQTDVQLGRVSRARFAADRFRGNVALYADFEDAEGSSAERGDPRVWFRDLQIGGSKLQVHEERAFGPVLFAQYTLSRGVLKMTAQMPPLGADEEQTVRLEIRQGGRWDTAAEEPIDELARTATFRLVNWDASQEVPYRLAYRMNQNDGLETYYYNGTIRQEPLERDTLVMGVLSCATHRIFPNKEVADGLRHHDPGLLAFTGDQFYESSGGYGVERRRDDVPLSTLDYLRKWYMHGWSFGEFMRDRPTICIIDDHDIFQGNVWGAGGRAVETYEEHSNGGYYMPAEWVNMVQRTQTSHLPDPFDPTPVEQGITVYYTDMLYGRVSLALMEDRKWKSGPNGLIPSHPGRVDHITDPDIDPKSLDMPGARLLGRRQLDFLDSWTEDWRGADAKVVVSQTAFASVATLHGSNLEYLFADLDSNGWPQTPRNEVLRRFRKGFAIQVGGDQHLPLIFRYGIDDFDDAGYIFCVPAIATGYLRAFEPREPGQHREPGSPEYTGQFRDGLGNRFTIHAVANPKRPFREDLLEQQTDMVSGYGIVRINKSEQTFTMEAWPVLSDPTNDADQFAGWPKTVHLEQNYGRPAAAYLPTLVFHGAKSPIVQVIDEDRNEVVYTLRIQGLRYRPKVFREGAYSVRVGDDSGWTKTIEGIQALGVQSDEVLELGI